MFKLEQFQKYIVNIFAIEILDFDLKNNILGFVT